MFRGVVLRDQKLLASVRCASRTSLGSRFLVVSARALRWRWAGVMHAGARFSVDTSNAFVLLGDGLAVELPDLALGGGLGQALPQLAYASLTPAGSEPWAFDG